MTITKDQRQELLSFNDGKPLIITMQKTSYGSDSFNITAFVRAIISPVPEYTNSVCLLLSLPFFYPNENPEVWLKQCKLFHPNFTDEGKWMGSSLHRNESFSDYLMRLIRVLQYKDINTEHIANRNAMAWYNKNRETEIFPTDIINYSIKPRISILSVNDNE